MGDGAEGLVEVQVEVVDVGVERDVEDHGEYVVCGAVIGNATVLGVMEYLLGGVEGEGGSGI